MPHPRTRTVRTLVQIMMVALMAWIGLRHQTLGGGPTGAPPLDSFCPFGAVETLPSLLGGTGFVRKVGESNLVLLAALGIVTLGFSGAFCGWICPFGAVQDWLASARKRVFGRVLVIPAPVHRVLRHLRWAVLALVVWMSARLLTLWFAEYDPFRALFHFKFESWIGVALVVGTVMGGLLVERFFCLYACPLGALVGLAGLVGLTRIRRVESECTECGVCSRACPSRIAVDNLGDVRDQHCTMCAECVESCPSDGALVVTTGAPGESLRPVMVGIASVVLFFALVGTAQALGWWRTGAGCAGCADAPGTDGPAVAVVATAGSARSGEGARTSLE